MYIPKKESISISSPTPMISQVKIRKSIKSRRIKEIFGFIFLYFLGSVCLSWKKYQVSKFYWRNSIKSNEFNKSKFWATFSQQNKKMKYLYMHLKVEWNSTSHTRILFNVNLLETLIIKFNLSFNLQVYLSRISRLTSLTQLIKFKKIQHESVNLSNVSVRY